MSAGALPSRTSSFLCFAFFLGRLVVLERRDRAIADSIDDEATNARAPESAELRKDPVAQRVLFHAVAEALDALDRHSRSIESTDQATNARTDDKIGL